MPIVEFQRGHTPYRAGERASFDAEHLLADLEPRLARKGPRRAVLLARAEEGRDVLPKDRKSTRLNSSHVSESRMPSSA